MNCEEVKRNFVEYWRGTLAPTELATFETHLASCEQCRSEAEGLKQIWSTLGEMPEADPTMRSRARFYAMLREMERREMERAHRFWWLRHPAFQAAFAILILVLGIGIGRLTTSGGGSGEVGQLRNEVNSMKQLVTLSLLQQQNATDRLRGVSWAYRVEPDAEVLAALLATVDHDPNVNVRLAAVDAMRNFSDNPVGRRGLIQALNKQESPLVEIAILDQLVEMREKSAKPAIDTLIGSPTVNPEVKQHGDWALRQLQ